MTARRPAGPAAVLLTSIALFAGCGGEDEGEDLASVADLTGCLSEAGFDPQPPGFSASALGNVNADFRAEGERGLSIDVAVVGTTEKAENAAADVRGALAGFGAKSAAVVQERNAIAVFDRGPNGEERASVEACLAG